MPEGEWTDAAWHRPLRGRQGQARFARRVRRALPPSRPVLVERRPLAHSGKEPTMTTASQAHETLDQLLAELHHADTLITEQADRIEALEDEVGRLRTAIAEASGAAA